MHPPQAERRAEARVTTRVPATVAVAGAPGGRCGVTLDLSAGGAQLDLPTPAPADLVDVTLRLDSAVVMAQAAVVRRALLPGGRHAIAVAFSQITPQERERLVAHVDRCRRVDRRHHSPAG